MFNGYINLPNRETRAAQVLALLILGHELHSYNYPFVYRLVERLINRGVSGFVFDSIHIDSSFLSLYTPGCWVEMNNVNTAVSVRFDTNRVRELHHTRFYHWSLDVLNYWGGDRVIKIQSLIKFE